MSRDNFVLPSTFQSTPPRGGRPSRVVSYILSATVSIHAPARGATETSHNERGWNWFQSTPPRGGRQATDNFLHDRFRFQSTPPRGGRREEIVANARESLFQSTPPRGGRRTSQETTRNFRKVSIHAPARGATQDFFGGFPSAIVSIHAPARGATADLIKDHEGYKVSIHAPARGATARQRFDTRYL